MNLIFELDFLSISNLIFAGYTGSKIQVWNTQTIKFKNKVKKIKLLKRGVRSIIKDPSILFNEKKQTLALHFDMHHGYGNLDKAINVMDEKDRLDFKNYVNTS